ncbi:symmetrical bis(5'-nucleosyl)-tetraphosphatase [Entomomonas asaccharolytica]|uniref:Bis(5'-nucleosyl)-tetraphosphatase, symmetrical n=1 Tax=Entomomonas asaccharolytica TaxID=2785331 RepID=A0A974NEH7_9GAMM|nr:symmetrical bis(5'-nucleosyl)-tetraphosphatase [Entomomonas asaccharolytica]QQP85171.1 symmetrical bis(5'-nucleosyl)-tetraphosphatase [Entomomonas asaccharolytica]
MAVYAIGDIQGCYEPLQRLLDEVNFDPAIDTLWCVGDLINRGAKSLKTLKFLYSIRKSVVTVLGNHDLHLIACFYDNAKIKKNDTIKEILEAKEAKELINWLRQQPLVYFDRDRKITMAHAGIPPLWTLEDSLARSAEVEAVLKDDKRIQGFLAHMYGSEPVNWSELLTGYERLRVITNYLTRMRFCKADGTIEFKSKEGLDSAPTGYIPWFEIANRKMAGQQILFGHWAALEGRCDEPNVYALDTGCVWGNCLTMMDVDTKEKFSTQCSPRKRK